MVALLCQRTDACAIVKLGAQRQESPGARSSSGRAALSFRPDLILARARLSECRRPRHCSHRLYGRHAAVDESGRTGHAGRLRPAAQTGERATAALAAAAICAFAALQSNCHVAVAGIVIRVICTLASSSAIAARVAPTTSTQEKDYYIQCKNKLLDNASMLLGQ